MGSPENEYISLIPNTEKDFQSYLKDESRKIGFADSMSFPANTAEVLQTLKVLYSHNIPVTIQGARTGVAAGAVPQGGHILNLNKMNQITGLRYDDASKAFFISVQPGVLLKDIREALRFKDFNTSNWTNESLSAYEKLKTSGSSWFFPPDPTETTASIGGMIACNASGPRSYLYGATRNYIQSLQCVLSNGSLFHSHKHESKAKDGLFTLRLSDKILTANAPKYLMPEVKNAAGYFSEIQMDMIDLIAGSEGTLAVVTEAEIMVIPEPEYKCAIVAFFPSETPALDFVITVRDSGNKKVINPAAIEFFDSGSLNLLRHFKIFHEAYEALPDLPEIFRTAVYLEFHCDISNAIDSLIDEVSSIVDKTGGNIDHTWVAIDNAEIEKMRFFRHAVPEVVNLLIGERKKKYPEITKLGTDMAVPDNFLREVIKMYSDDIASSGLEAVKFGHIGNNHIHVNILPNNALDYEKGKALYTGWAGKVIVMGGTISAEHGVGKLKVSFLKQMYGNKGIEEMKALKLTFDPKNLLNRGNLFSD